MKKLLLITILSSSSVWAYDFNMNSTSELTDLMYMPIENTFAGCLNLSHSRTTIDYEYVSRNLMTVKSNELSSYLQAGYTIKPNTVLYFKVSNQLNGKNEVSYGPASNRPNTSKTEKSNGMEDPLIGFKYRFTNQDQGRFNQDLSLSFSPKIKDNIDATENNIGNAYRGSSLLEFNYELGRKYTDQSWKFSALVDFIGKRTSINADNSSKVSTTDAMKIYGLSFTWQWVVYPQFLLNLSGAANLINDSAARNPGEGTSTLIDSYSYFTAGADLIFKMDQKLNFQLGLRTSSLEDSLYKETTLSSGSVTTVNIKNGTNTTISLSAWQEF